MQIRTVLRRALGARPTFHTSPGALAFALILAAGAFVGSAAPCSAQGSANGQSPPLEIRTGFLKSAKFVYKDAEPQKVHGWVSFSTEFTDLLAMHPEALAEANKAKPFFALGLIGSVGMLAVSTKMLIETINDAQDVQSGNIDSSTGTTSWTDVGLIAGFGAVAVVSALVAKGHMNRSVELFNSAEGWTSGGGAGARLTFGLTRLDGRRSVTWRVALPM